MPVTRVETAFPWPAQTRRQILDAVQRCLVEALKIPEHDRYLRFITHNADDFLAPPDAGPRSILIEICLFPGRSLEAKRALYRSLVQALAAFDIPPSDTRIVLLEAPFENWGIRGGQAACDVDLGFKVDV